MTLDSRSSGRPRAPYRGALERARRRPVHHGRRAPHVAREAYGPAHYWGRVRTPSTFVFCSLFDVRDGFARDCPHRHPVQWVLALREHPGEPLSVSFDFCDFKGSCEGCREKTTPPGQGGGRDAGDRLASRVRGSGCGGCCTMGMASRKGTLWPLEKGPPFLSCGGRRDVAGRSGATGGQVAASAIAVAPPVSRGTRGCVWRP